MRMQLFLPAVITTHPFRITVSLLITIDLKKGNNKLAFGKNKAAINVSRISQIFFLGISLHTHILDIHK